MVQVLPSKTNAGSQIGAGLGQGLAQGLAQGGEIGMQRGMLQAGLDQFRNMDRANTTPFDLAANLIQATAGVPGAERYVGQLFPLLMSQLQGQTASNTGVPSTPGNLPAPNAGTTAGNNQTPGTGQSPTPNDPMAFLQNQQQQLPTTLPPLPQPSTQSNLFQGTLEPTSLGMGPVPAQYDENQIIKARNEDLSAGFPNSPRAETMEKYNQLAQARVESMTRAAETQASIGALSAKRQEDFRGVLQNQLGIQDPSKLAVAEMMANEDDTRNIANDVIRAEKVKKKFDPYEAALDEFTRSSARPNGLFNRNNYEKSIENLKSKMQPFIKYGQRNEANRILSEKGWSESEIAKITNPLPSSMKDQIKKLPSISGSFAISPSGMPSQLSERAREQGIGVWENFLSKNFKTGVVDPRKGDVIQPGTSLILLRNEALRKGMNGIDFDSMMNSMLRQGKIQLDPYQNRELQMMSQNPSRVWSIYELLMGEQR